MEPLRVIELSVNNIDKWPKFRNLFDAGKIVVDAHGRLRYPHGAPVGKLILVRTEADGSPVYKESAEEWFDPDSPAADAFVWPK